MSEAGRLQVLYPHYNETPPLLLERLVADDVTGELSAASLGLMATAYTRAIGNESVPIDVIRSQLNPNDPRQVQAAQAEMTARITSGRFQYWTARNQINAARMEGLALLRQGLSESMAAYLCFIVARQQYAGVGSSLLHAALSHGGYAVEGEVAVDAFAPSEAESWYTHIGFRAGAMATTDTLFANYPIALRAYGGVTAYKLVDAFERRRPALARARKL